MKAVLALALATAASGLSLSKTNVNEGVALTNTFKVYVEGQPVLGDGAGTGALKKCNAFPDFMVAHPMKPGVKVCGTGIKMTVFLLGRCGKQSTGRDLATAGMAPKWTIGACDKGLDANTCKTFSPKMEKAFGAAQSYMIEQC